jgi:hypothetical protein
MDLLRFTVVQPNREDILRKENSIDKPRLSVKTVKNVVLFVNHLRRGHHAYMAVFEGLEQLVLKKFKN